MQDNTGQTLNSSYDVWGNILSQEELVHNPFRYSGEYWDDSTKLQYLRTRWYDPNIGRFINEDTYEDELNNSLSLNLYTYVHNNPLIYADPTGHKIWLIHGTFSNPETWTPEFKEYIGELYDEDVSTHRWTGGNDKPARKEGSEALADEII
ncbi:RHS repeat-associated core domain-containing protein [Paenibacillus sp. 453mf]|uniref:RHS repeat-associated core domain-containing protein n=1 Tax=Paenibacillus sp. 453mf TaxID=1761874 RepID=UPI00329878A2